jgi:hypothetical protein
MPTTSDTLKETVSVSTSPSGQSSRAEGQMPLSAILRGVAVMLGPSLLLDLLVAGSTLATLNAFVARCRTGRGGVHLGPVFGAALPWLCVTAIRPRMARWGATDQEVEISLPGDEVNARPAFVSTRAITVKAPLEVVWPWLAQIGQDRGGFYSFTVLENLGGAHIKNADRIHPEWQQRSVGDVVWMTPFNGPKVVSFRPPRAIVVEGGWTFALCALDRVRTRFILRSRSPGWQALYAALLMDVPHFIMEVGMLRGLKRRAELDFAATLARRNGGTPKAVTNV